MSNFDFGYWLKALCLSLVFALLGAATLQAEASENILFYGNSFTRGAGSSSSVPDLVQSIAIAAGRASPNVVNAAVGGKDFTFHITRNFPIINNGIPTTEHWDFVVMQNFSTAPTVLGDLSQHRSDSVSLYQKVADRSPGVTPVLFETWARAPGHDFYDPPLPKFPGGAAEMQQELREGYFFAAEDIDAAAGPGTARIAPVGDAWESLDWMIGTNKLHSTDLYHAANPGTLLAALTIYGTIYQDDTVDIDLGSILEELNLPAIYGPRLASAADQTVVRAPEPSTCLLLLLACGGNLCCVQKTTNYRR